ncbi:MAG: peptidoglycan-binding protein, partial [Lachnospiraceae bacterium]|nr:peptidoglycan-binding protein [Lachnospiraceae bacterium]
GKSFTITSSTAYDQKWMTDRNIFENIDYIVDSIFNNFLSRPGIRQPILTSYCDGNRVTCSGLSQWGSKSLGDAGYSAIDIIHYYYGDDMYINSADAISGVPSSWPGYTLTIGSSSEKVRQLQEQLNRIAKNYPAIPKLNADGVYGPSTAESVRIFQRVFDLPQTGTVDFATWYKISDLYVGVSQIAEPGAY